MVDKDRKPLDRFKGLVDRPTLQPRAVRVADVTHDHDDLPIPPFNTLPEKTVPVAADILAIEDSEDSNAKKKLQIGNLQADLEADIAALLALINALPQGSLGKAVAITGQGSISTTEVDRTDLSVTLDIPAGRLIKVKAYSLIGTDTTGNTGELRIYDSGGQKAIGRVLTDTDGAMALYVATPTYEPTGTHTFKVTVAKASGGPGGFISSPAAATAPAWIEVEDWGAAPV